MNVHTRDAGDDSQPAIFFGHSLMYDGEMWAAQQTALTSFRTIAVDFRGHGRTQWPGPGDVSLDDLADDVARLADERGLDTFGYCGLSLGGMVGMRLALRHPDRVHALALLNTSADAEDENKRELYHAFNESSRNKPSDDGSVAFLLALTFSESFRESNSGVIAKFHRKLMDPPDPEGLYWVGKAVIWRESILERIREIQCPTLVVTSTGDQSIAPSHAVAIAGRLPRSQLITFQDSGHMTAVEVAGEVTAQLQTFFSEAA